MSDPRSVPKAARDVSRVAAAPLWNWNSGDWLLAFKLIGQSLATIALRDGTIQHRRIRPANSVLFFYSDLKFNGK